MKRAFLSVSLAVLAAASVLAQAVNPNASGTQGQGGFVYGEPTEFEQLMLEMLNRARANPVAEAARMGIDLNEGLPPNTLNPTPKPPLAFHVSLIASSRGHSQWMLDSKTFSHSGAGGSTTVDRIKAAGYPLLGSWRVGENIVWHGTTGFPDVSFISILHARLFKSPQHRVTMLDPEFRQVGIGVLEGRFPSDGILYNSVMVTQDFAIASGSPSTSGPFVTGVVYADLNTNGSYDPGEGLKNVSVQLLPGDLSTKTSAFGGYGIPIGTTSGQIVLTFSGGGLPQAIQKTALVKLDENTKADLLVESQLLQTRVIALTGDLNHGQVTVGTLSVRVLTVSNHGNLPLTVTGFSHPESVFLGNGSGTIPPGESRSIKLGFSPKSAGIFSGTLQVLSNATGGINTIEETGEGVAAPVVSAPVISPSGATFSESVTVKVTCETPGALICYTADGTEPTPKSWKVANNETGVLKKSLRLKFKAFKQGYQASPTVSADFIKTAAP